MGYAGCMAPDDDDLWQAAMSDVIPLNDRDRVGKQPKPGSAPPATTSPRFTVDGDEGRADGVNNKQLAKLRSGQVDIGARVDLHRARVDAARQQVARKVGEAAQTGVRCVLIVHGKGLHSAGAPVLRDAVVATLTSGACAKHVLAFCPALPKHGGAGAMYVLLRR